MMYLRLSLAGACASCRGSFFKFAGSPEAAHWIPHYPHRGTLRSRRGLGLGHD